MVGSKKFPPAEKSSSDILTLHALSVILVFGGILAFIFDPPSIFLVIVIVLTFWILSHTAKKH